MRIALVARGCRPGAGIELYTHELANRLSQGHEVSVITNPKEVKECHAVVVPVSIPTKPLWHSILAFSTKAGFVARQQEYDVVHTQGSDGNWGDVVTAHSCHRAGMHASLKLNPTFRNTLRKWFSPAHRVVVAQERSALYSARIIVAVSKHVARQIQVVYPFTRSKPIRIIYPGVDSQIFSPDKLVNTRVTHRRQFGFVEEDIVFTLVANAPCLKGAGRLLQALACLENEKTHLLIASSTTRFPRLRRMVKRLGLEKRVHFTQARQNTIPVYAAGDIYAALPEYESFGLTVLEAMACGLPVILTRNAGVAELLTSGTEGLLLPFPSKLEGVVQAMERLSTEERVREQMGLAARATAEKYTWEKTVQQVEAIYAQVVNEKQKQDEYRLD
jgi:UDP-glucose:(heptosyl)LPS alpha-1,3-glucosyltransferase